MPGRAWEPRFGNSSPRSPLPHPTHSAASPAQALPLVPRDGAQLYAHNTQSRCQGRSRAGHLGGALARFSRSWGSPKEGGPRGESELIHAGAAASPQVGLGPGRMQLNPRDQPQASPSGLDQHLGSGAGCSPKQLGDLEDSLWPPGSPHLIYRMQLVP